MGVGNVTALKTDKYDEILLQVSGQWKGQSAGGCGNYRDSHSCNPIYQLRVDGGGTDNFILVELLGPK